MCHVQSLEKDFYLGTFGSFDYDFTHYMNFSNMSKGRIFQVGHILLLLWAKKQPNL